MGAKFELERLPVISLLLIYPISNQKTVIKELCALGCPFGGNYHRKDLDIRFKETNGLDFLDYASNWKYILTNAGYKRAIEPIYKECASLSEKRFVPHQKLPTIRSVALDIRNMRYFSALYQK